MEFVDQPVLHQRGVERSSERSCTVGRLAVVGGNARARRFYERRGWKDDGLIDYPAATATGPVILPAHRYVKRITDLPLARDGGR